MSSRARVVPDPWMLLLRGGSERLVGRSQTRAPSRCVVAVREPLERWPLSITSWLRFGAGRFWSTGHVGMHDCRVVAGTLAETA